MTNADDSLLMQVLLSDYEELLKRLTRGLGSRDLANEALQETYLRLKRGGIGEVEQPRAYLLRMAANIAKNRLRTENHYVASGLSEAFEDLVDESPGPARAAEAQSDLQVLRVALEQLPSMRRAIFEAAFVHDEPLPVLAHRYGVSLRTVQREVARALEHVHNVWEDSLGQARRDSPRRRV